MNQPRPSSTSLADRTLLAVLCTLLILAPHPAFAAAPTTQPLPTKPADLYTTTAVYTVHLTFTPDQWQAMNPKYIGRSPFGPPGFRPPSTRPVRPQPDSADAPRRFPPPPGPNSFGPANFLAPPFFAAADQNRDNKLSRDEFQSLAQRWFTDWDKQKLGKLSLEQLRDGLDSAFTPPNPGQRPGGPPDQGFVLNLQGTQGNRNGLASAMGLEFNYVHANLEFQGHPFNNVATRYKGNGTWMESNGSDKRSLKIELNKFVKGQKLAGVTTLNFHNCVTDASFMNEVLSHKLFRDAAVPAPRTAYARVYLTVPGAHDRKYLGLYSMIENLDTPFVHEFYNTKGGALFKPVTPQPFTDVGDDWANYKQPYDPKTGVSKKEAQRIIDFARLVSHAPDDEFAARLADYLDLDNFSRFMAVTVYLSTLDSILLIGQNYYVYLHPKTNKLHFMPWDLDHSFGQFPLAGNQDIREQLSIQHPWRGNIRLLDRTFNVETFKKLYLARLEEFSKTIFTPERFHQQVDQIAAAIRPAAQEESPVKLARLNRVAAGQSPNGPGAFDALFGRGRGSLVQGPKPIKAFVKPRTQSILDQLADKSKGLTLDFNQGPAIAAPPGPRPRGPGNFLAPAFMAALDSNKDNHLAREEFTQGFANWFTSWNTDQSTPLTPDQFRTGFSKILPSPRPPFAPPPPGAPR